MTQSKLENALVITIDGPSGTGKGTLCQMLAHKLHWNILDSGSLYRVLAYAAKQHAVALDNEEVLTVLGEHLDVQFKVKTMATPSRVILEGEDVTDLIRSEECSNDASKVAVLAGVRKALLARQRAFCEAPGLVTDGRDMGTVVFPHAFIKIYLDASIDRRAQRRHKQLKEKGINASLAQVLEELKVRDGRDKKRAISPLMPAKDAIIVDTTHLTAEQAYKKVLSKVEKKLHTLVT